MKQAPKYLLDNEHIHTGYRIGFNSFTKILRSLFMIHNESVNVWTHLIGVMIFLLFICYTAIKLGPRIDSEIHIKIMDQFHNLYHMGDSLCEGDEIEEFTDKIFKIYEEGIQISQNSCHSEKTFHHHEGDFKCEVSEGETYFDSAIENSTFSHFDKNLDFILDRVETYIHSLVEGVKILSLTIRCPEKLNVMFEKAKNMTSNFHLALTNYIETVQEGVLDSYKNTRMVTLKSITSKVSDLFHEIGEAQASGSLPDITFPSYFESPGEILHDITRIPLYIHIFAAIFCLGCSAVFHLFYVHSPKVSEILARLDYAGISLLIGGSGVPPIYYSLYCSDHDFIRPLYLTISFVG